MVLHQGGFKRAAHHRKQLLGILHERKALHKSFNRFAHFLKASLPSKWLFLGSPMLMDPHANQQHSGLHPDELTRSKARFKSTSARSLGRMGREGVWQSDANNLGQWLHLNPSPWVCPFLLENCLPGILYSIYKQNFQN